MISVLQDQRNFNAGPPVSFLTQAYGSNIALGSSLHIWATCSSSPTPTFSCSDTLNGSLGSPLDFITSPGGQCYGHWILDGSLSGADSVTVNFGATVGQAQIIIKEVGGTSGLDTSATAGGHKSADQINPGTGTDAVSSGSITPSKQPGLVSCITSCVTGTASLTVGTGFTLDHAFSSNTQTEHLRYTSTSPVAGTWTDANGASNEMITFAACFKEAGAPIVPSAGAIVLAGAAPSLSQGFKITPQTA